MFKAVSGNDIACRIGDGLLKSAAVIQAAGKGSRFHSNQYKLLTPVNGSPMIIRTLEPVLQAGFDEIVVVTGAHADKMRDALAGYPVKIIVNPEWEKGQSTTLSAGVRAIAGTSDRACLLLGDQPYLKKETLSALLRESDKYPDEIIVPFYQGKRGNPIIVPAARYALMLELSQGDNGGKQLLATVGYHQMDSADRGVLRDIDTVEELNRYEQDK